MKEGFQTYRMPKTGSLTSAVYDNRRIRRKGHYLPKGVQIAPDGTVCSSFDDAVQHGRDIAEKSGRLL